MRREQLGLARQPHEALPARPRAAAAGCLEAISENRGISIAVRAIVSPPLRGETVAVVWIAGPGFSMIVSIQGYLTGKRLVNFSENNSS